MNTQYILGGGYTSKAEDGGLRFYQSVIGERKSAKVLICAFAAEQEHYDQNFQDYREKLEEANPYVELEFKNADPEIFTKQINWADVIVYLGGQSSTLMEVLLDIPNWRTCNLSGKTVVGSSAGAYMLSKAYIETSEEAQLLSGFGFVPAIIVAHNRKARTSDDGVEDPRSEYWDEVDKLMSTQARDIPGMNVCLLREGEFITITT